MSNAWSPPAGPDWLLRCLVVGLFLYAGALLSIGIDRDWRLRHEDNGATYSTLALSHLHLGLSETRGHDFFYNPHTGEKIAYGHHPPGLALVLAATFQLAGSAQPWVARSVPLLFHLGSLAVLLRLLSLLLDRQSVVFGGFVMATLPESAFYGRMVGYEPLGLFCVMLQLYAYSAYRVQGHWWALWLLTLGVLLGGALDWAPLYFSLGLCLREWVGWLRGNREARVWRVLAAAGLSITVLDLVHMAYAFGALHRLTTAVTENPYMSRQTFMQPLKFLLTQLEVHRRLFTHTSLVCCLVTLLALLGPTRRVLTLQPPLVRDVLGVCFAAGLAYLLSIAGYAMSHQYSQFYLLPAVLLSMSLVWQSLRARQARQPHRLVPCLMGLVLLEVGITSAIGLTYRHTHAEPYALRTTAQIRASYLPPPPPTGQRP